MFEVFIVTAESNLSQKDFSSLLSLTSHERRNRINHYHFFKDAQNTLLGDILVRAEICKRTGLSNRHLVFSTNEHGKPFLVNEPHLHFNISHAGKFIAVALDSEPVGIDVELIKSIDLKITERFFATDENEYITSHTDETRIQTFFEIWTKKESYIKREGLGLARPLNSFSVLNANAEQTYFHCVFTDNDATCHVCTSHREPPRCKKVEIAEILKFAKK